MASKAGFYKRDGDKLLFSATPKEGWSYYKSKKEAAQAELTPVKPPIEAPRVPVKESPANKLVSRIEARASAREEDRVKRDKEQIARLEATRPEFAAQIKVVLEARAERRARKDSEKAAKRLERLQRKETKEGRGRLNFEWPSNPERFQTVTTPDGATWIFDQPRDSNGRFTSDDPSTLTIESAMRWILVPSTP